MPCMPIHVLNQITNIKKHKTLKCFSIMQLFYSAINFYSPAELKNYVHDNNSFSHDAIKRMIIEYCQKQTLDDDLLLPGSKTLGSITDKEITESLSKINITLNGAAWSSIFFKKHKANELIPIFPLLKESIPDHVDQQQKEELVALSSTAGKKWASYLPSMGIGVGVLHAQALKRKDPQGETQPQKNPRINFWAEAAEPRVKEIEEVEEVVSNRLAFKIPEIEKPVTLIWKPQGLGNSYMCDSFYNPLNHQIESLTKTTIDFIKQQKFIDSNGNEKTLQEAKFMVGALRLTATEKNLETFGELITLNEYLGLSEKNTPIEVSEENTVDKHLFEKNPKPGGLMDIDQLLGDGSTAAANAGPQ